MERARIWLTTLGAVKTSMHPTQQVSEPAETAEVWVIVYDGFWRCCPLAFDENGNLIPQVDQTRWLVVAEAAKEGTGFIYLHDWTGKLVPDLLPLPDHVVPSTATVIPSPSSAASRGSAQPSTSPSPVAGGCGSTQVFAGPGPDAALGLADNPWAPATPADAGIVAYFWYPPPDLLFAAGPNDFQSKILWISHGQQAERLTIAAHPLDASSPVVRFDFPPASSPSGNYPSGIDLPSPGCWRLELTLGSAHATMDVMVAADAP